MQQCHQRCRGVAAQGACAGWRDLTRSKQSLLKGDDHLDRVYAASGHHITDAMLSAHSACVCLARMLPVATLEEHVRLCSFLQWLRANSLKLARCALVISTQGVTWWRG